MSRAVPVNSSHPRGSVTLSTALIAGGTLAAGLSEKISGAQLRHAISVMVLAFAANLAVALWDKSREQVETGSGFIPLVIAALAYGPRATLLVAIISCLPYVASESPARFLRRMATRVLASVAVAVLFQHPDRHHVQAFLVNGLGCALAYQAIQLSATALVTKVEQGGRLWARMRWLWPHFALGVLIFGPMTVAYAYLLPQAPGAVLLASFAVVASHQLLITVQRSRSVERLLSTMSAEIPGALLAALDAADAYTAQHSAGVASYSYDLARARGYEPRRSRQVHAAALLHDVGKIGVPDAVLTKDGPLADEEWLLIRRHPEVGANMITHIPGFGVLEAGILHHHERFDGSGYPHGVAGADIPEEAQIIAVADTYSAITTSRVYRKARSPEYALQELQRDAERGRLNPELVALFVELIRNAPVSYQLGRHTNLAMEVAKVQGWLDVFHDADSEKRPDTSPPDASSS